MTDDTAAPIENAESTNDDWGNDRPSVAKIENEDIEERESTLYADNGAEDPEVPGSQEEPTQAATEDTATDRTPSSAPKDDQPRLTPQEYALLNKTVQESQQLRQNEAKLRSVLTAVQQAGGDLAALYGGDKGKAAAARVEIQQLAKTVAEGRQREQSINQNVQEAVLVGHQRDMMKAEPALADDNNRTELAKWLVDKGYSIEDVSAINTRQAVAAWRLFQTEKKQATKVLPAKFRLRVPRKAGTPKVEAIDPGTKRCNDFYGFTPDPDPPSVPTRDSRVGLFYGTG